MSVCEETDLVIVVGCTPAFGKLGTCQLIIFNAETFAHVRTISLADCYEIPRCAIAIGRNFAICHGYKLKRGTVKLISFLYGTGTDRVPAVAMID